LIDAYDSIVFIIVQVVSLVVHSACNCYILIVGVVILADICR